MAYIIRIVIYGLMTAVGILHLVCDRQQCESDKGNKNEKERDTMTERKLDGAKWALYEADKHFRSDDNTLFRSTARGLLFMAYSRIHSLERAHTQT